MKKATINILLVLIPIILVVSYLIFSLVHAGSELQGIRDEMHQISVNSEDGLSDVEGYGLIYLGFGYVLGSIAYGYIIVLIVIAFIIPFCGVLYNLIAARLVYRNVRYLSGYRVFMSLSYFFYLILELYFTVFAISDMGIFSIVTALVMFLGLVTSMYMTYSKWIIR